MLKTLGPLHEIAARRGDGLLPEFVRLLLATQVKPAPIPDSNPIVSCSRVGRTPLRPDTHAENETPAGGNILPLPAKKERSRHKRQKSAVS
jgi:hypothetical protein